MNWWVSSSRDRGIGIYLIGFFNNYFSWDNYIPLWLIPNTINKNSLMELKATFKYGEYCSSHSQNYSYFICDSGKLIEAKNIFYALSGSPFERTSSLLNDVDALIDVNIPLHVIIHDLLPLVFKKKILECWQPKDQELYLQQVNKLNHVAQLLVTGTSSCAHIAYTLPSLLSLVSIIPFEETSKWIQIPQKINNLAPLMTSKYAVTISGGEWRKNLRGTLLFFAVFFPKTWRLVVICKLGRVEKIKYMYLAYKLGILNRVIFTGKISDQIKWNYLVGMKVLLSLSFGEGLNLPIREARRIGKPIINLEDARAFYMRYF